MHAHARRAPLLLLLLAASLCLSPQRARADATAEGWTRVSTESFRLVGNASESELRRMAARLEQFRRAFVAAFPEVRGGPGGPAVTVVVFRDHDSYAPFRPTGDAAGFFQPGDDTSYIALVAPRHESGRGDGTLFHEYAHMLIRAALPEAPLWLSEGLAEVCASVELSDGGRRARVGRPPGHHAATLRSAALTPLPELLAVRHDSPDYTVASRRRLFYAQSWALTHFLLYGREGSRREALWRYASQPGRGAEARRRFAEAFSASPDEVGREFAAYVAHGKFPGRELRPDGRAAVAPAGEGPRAVALSPAEAHAQLGDLLLHLNRYEEAEEHLRRALALDAALPAARSSLGMLRVRQGRLDEALPELERAVGAEGASPQAHYSYALALSRSRAGVDPTGRYRPETEARLRVHLTRAVELAPRYADAHELLALVELGAGDLERAETLLRRASALVPARAPHHAVTLAQVSAQRGDYASARALLEGAARDAAEEHVRARAAELLEGLRRQEEYEARLARGENMSGELPPYVAPSVGSIRPKVEGQEQARGVLTVVECTPEEVYLHLQVEGRTLRFRAADFERIPFVSYDPEMARGKGRKLSCGERTASNHVLLTYRPAGARPGADGEVVAVDFVPKDWR